MGLRISISGSSQVRPRLLVLEHTENLCSEAGGRMIDRKLCSEHLSPSLPHEADPWETLQKAPGSPLGHPQGALWGHPQAFLQPRAWEKGCNISIALDSPAPPPELISYLRALSPAVASASCLGGG